MLRLLRDAGNLSDGGLYLVQRCHEVSSCGKALRSIRENDGSADAAARVDAPVLVVREVAADPMAFVVAMLHILILIEVIHFFSFAAKTTFFSYCLNPKYTMSIPISPIRSPFFSLCLVFSSELMSLKMISMILRPLGYRNPSLRLRPRILIDMCPLSFF